jgi:heat shock protein HspQ
MSATIQNISLYIPHIFANYTKEYVSKVFEDHNIGKVKNIDLVSKMSQDGKFYSAAYIHFEEWYNTIATRNFQARVHDTSKEARIMYEEPWYWIVLENKARKFISGDRKPRIILNEETTPVQTTQVKASIANSIDWTQAPKAHKKVTASLPVPVKNVQKTSTAPAPPAFVANEEDADWLDYIQEEDAQMDEVEAAIDEEDQYLTSIDSRYIHALEEENMYFRQLCDQYYAEYCKTVEMYKTEAIKSQVLAETIQMIKK